MTAGRVMYDLAHLAAESDEQELPEDDWFCPDCVKLAGPPESSQIEGDDADEEAEAGTSGTAVNLEDVLDADPDVDVRVTIKSDPEEPDADQADGDQAAGQGVETEEAGTAQSTPRGRPRSSTTAGRGEVETPRKGGKRKAEDVGASGSCPGECRYCESSLPRQRSLEPMSVDKC